MKKSLVFKILAMIVAITALTALFVACSDGEEVATIKEYQTEDHEFAVGDSFSQSSITIKALLTDGTIKTVNTSRLDLPLNYKTALNLTKDEVDGSEVWKFGVAGTYNITVSYLGDQIDVKIVVK